MTTPLHRTIEGLRHLTRITSASLVRGKCFARESEASFVLQAERDAIETLEQVERGDFSDHGF